MLSRGNEMLIIMVIKSMSFREAYKVRSKDDMKKEIQKKRKNFDK